MKKNNITKIDTISLVLEVLNQVEHIGSKSKFTDIDMSLSKLQKNKRAKLLAQQYGLKIQNVCWEDTARTKGSCLGPNISDMTLYVEGQGRMPVIRKPNFADITADIPSDKFSVTVGNQSESDLSRVSFPDYLKNFTKYNPGVNVTGDMFLERDSTLLASSQTCILPLTNGEVEFNVNLYNYQSHSKHSTVLVIVVSSQGTSSQVITGGTQKLYFRLGDKKTNYVAQRLEDDRKERGVSTTGAMTSEEQERNVLFIYQIPLKPKPKQRTFRGCVIGNQQYGYSLQGNPASSEEEMAGGYSSDDWGGGCLGGDDDDDWGPESSVAKRGMDNAMLRAGEIIGDYDEITQKLERDTKYPIRLTLQYYKVTDNSYITNSQMEDIYKQVSKIYHNATDTGSLVLNTTDRPTEPVLQQEAGSLDDVNKLHQEKPLMAF